MKTENKNVIDLSERRAQKQPSEKLQNLKLRQQLDQVRLMLPMSLLSILLLVTLANNSLMTVPTATPVHGDRGIASVATGTPEWEDRMVAKFRQVVMQPDIQIGQKPSILQQLTMGLLEGRYSIRLQGGQVQEIQLTEQDANSPALMPNREKFLYQHRDVLPPFASIIRIETKSIDKSKEEIGQRMPLLLPEPTIESYELLDNAQRRVARVKFVLDSESHLYSMKVVPEQLALK